MQKVLLDTNKIINILKGNKQDVSWFTEQCNKEHILFFTTPLIRHEVLRFYDYSDSNAIEYKRAEQFLSALEIINIDKNITDQILLQIFLDMKEHVILNGIKNNLMAQKNG
ncbi:PIN domain-containing protein [Gallibacterium anatis]|uniref:PIN domain-containing protein n=1 Tax=Gallibacterium anatis TaxID=750 RepID=UPI0039FCD88C